MKKITFLFLCFVAVVSVQAQTLDADLKAKQAEIAAAEEALVTLQAEADAIAASIETGAGWITGFGGNVGFNFNKSNGWIANPNPDASSSGLAIGLTGFANNITENFFWRNKGILNKAWQDIDLSDADDNVEGDGLFDNGTVDLLNLSSLAGKPISDHWAISGLGELNTSLGNFLAPGTLDIGVGITWTPDIDDLIVVIHPLNYHFAFAGKDENGERVFSSATSLGAKVRADYTHDWDGFAYSSTFTTFLPYQSTDEGIPSLFEWTWLNTLTFDIWKGIGVGISAGFRNAEFETPGDLTNLQSFYSVGLSYAL
jgi:hypothetical protein